MIFPTTDYAKSANKYENLKSASETLDLCNMKEESASSSLNSTMENTPTSDFQKNVYDQTQKPSNLSLEVVMRRRGTSENDHQMEVDDEASTSVPQVGKAFYGYIAKEKDELTFERGSVVEILNKDVIDQGWIYARIGEKEGMIPENYVRLVGRQLKEINETEIVKYERIGSGAFSHVYHGKWKDEEVALKQPKNLRLPSAKLVEVIKQEALIYARLKHENIVRFYGICFNIHCLVLEFCNGGTLFDLNRKLEYSIPIRVVNWALQIASGMEHFQKRERDQVLIHADLKAANVLIKEVPCLCDHVENPREMVPGNFENGLCIECGNTDLDRITLKLTDFGLSRVENSDRRSVAGSGPWMSPEVVRNGQYSKASDVYSFGIVMWELVTTEKPFKQIDGNDVLFAVAQFQKPEIPSDCPQLLSKLMRWCWEKNPKDRPLFKEIITELKNAQIYADLASRRKLDYKNSTKIKMREEDVEIFKRALESSRAKYIQNVQTTHLYKEAPKIATRQSHAKNKVKITKNEISSPSDFKHVVSVVPDNQKDAKQSNNNQRYKVEYPNDQSGNLTLPRNHKHSTQSVPNQIPNNRVRSKSKGAQSAPNNLQDQDGQSRRPPFFPPTSKQNSNPLFSTHGIKRNENEGYNNDHLNPMSFGPPLKAAKSNPELVGPSSLLVSKHSRATPLGRSNATRKKNIEPDNSAKNSSVITPDSTKSDILLTDISPAPIFRSEQQRGRNQSDSSLGLDSPSSTLRSNSSTRGIKGMSRFYVDEEDSDDSSQTNLQEAQANKKRSGAGSFIKNIRGMFSSPKSTSTNDTEPPPDSTLMVCDRPPLPACHHPNHVNDFISSKTHLCALAEGELTCQYVLRHEPEILDFISQTRQQTETRNSLRPFLKASDDPHRKRRATGNTSQNSGNVVNYIGGRTTAQVIARKPRKSTSISEADEQLNSSNEALAPATSTETIQVVGYEPIHIGNAHSVGDLRMVGIDLQPSPTENLHQRSRSSDAQPETEEMDWTSSPITNICYVPLPRGSVIGGNSSLYAQPNTGVAVNLNDVTSEVVLNQFPKNISPPVPPPRARPMDFPPPPIGSTSRRFNNNSPGSGSTTPIETVKFRTNHQSPTSGSHTVLFPHKRRTNLNTPVTGSNMINGHIVSNSRKLTPEHTSRSILDEPVSGQASNLQSLEDSDFIELYGEVHVIKPIINPTYRTQTEMPLTDIPMAIPNQRAPPPPLQKPNLMPKFLPTTRSQFRKTSPRPPNF